MMDLTPLDVRKKKGDFRRGIRGYEQAQVDDFLDLVADRMETLVRDASSVGERIARLEQQVSDYRDREKALTEALVSAQQMREDIRTQSTREVELLRKQAEQDAERIRAEAVRMRDREEQALEGLRSRQFQFLASYRKYLEQELSELTAMAQGLEMHVGGARAAPGHAVSSAARTTPQPFEAPTAVSIASPPAPAHADQDATGRVAGPMTSPASPASESTFGSPVTPAVPVPFVVSAPADTQTKQPGAASPEAEQEAPASSPPASVTEARSAQTEAVSPEPVADFRSAAEGAAVAPAAEADTSEAHLEEALARWEPELGPESQAPATEVSETEDTAELELAAEVDAGLELESVVEADLEFEATVDADLAFEPADEADLELESADEADLELESAVEADLELDSADGADLLLSSDGEVAAAAAQSSNAPVDSEDDVDLAFLEFGEDDDVPAEDPAVAAAAAEAVEREVSAALVESHGDYIDIGTALGDDRDEIELPIDAIADVAEPAVAEPAVDEAEAAIDAAFAFDEGEAEGVTETRMWGPRVEESPPAPSQAVGQAVDLADDIAFVDSLLVDAASMFEEEPSEESLDREPAVPVDEAAEDPFGDTEFDGIAAEADRTDDYAQDDESGSADPDRIDLDSFRGFSTYEPPAPGKGDVSSLTLHPMFFEREPSDLDGGEHEESKQDHWSSSGGG